MDTTETPPASNDANFASATNTRTFTLANFEGPLDLLLFLIKKNEVSIYDIPISQITEQYLGFLSTADQYDIDDLASFQSLAATLLYIKSRMLLPVEVNLEEEIEDPRSELIETLIEYQKFKKLSRLMQEKERDAEWAVERGEMRRTLPFAQEPALPQADAAALFRVFTGLLKKIAPERFLDLYEEVTINEKITLIEELIDERGECYFTDLITRENSLMDIVCAFLSVLEAVKLRLIHIYQARMWGNIALRKWE